MVAPDLHESLVSGFHVCSHGCVLYSIFWTYATAAQSTVMAVSLSSAPHCTFERAALSKQTSYASYASLLPDLQDCDCTQPSAALVQSVEVLQSATQCQPHQCMSRSIMLERVFSA